MSETSKPVGSTEGAMDVYEKMDFVGAILGCALCIAGSIAVWFWLPIEVFVDIWPAYIGFPALVVFFVVAAVETYRSAQRRPA